MTSVQHGDVFPQSCPLGGRVLAKHTIMRGWGRSGKGCIVTFVGCSWICFLGRISIRLTEVVRTMAHPFKAKYERICLIYSIIGYYSEEDHVKFCCGYNYSARTRIF